MTHHCPRDWRRGAETGDVPDDSVSITFGKASAFVLKVEIHNDWTEIGLMSMNLEEATIAKYHKAAGRRKLWPPTAKSDPFA